MRQEMMKLLQSVFCRICLAENYPKSVGSVSECFPTLRLPLASTQNGNTSAAKIMGQEIMKLLPEM